ncbi:unnamed protein product (macronuclear) [Paramecium tetraurelia]|uniref:Uncharacterized protein n=1 Tax=Paramecium tetraurelia TaxID=5888 RepID=A0CC81_PARTE|nr:uncharacterized protein GSPATT00037182001 [Paramecium tetraurelia]CAK68398.1 unnamed protein product [Paramecium tetraurelia]|eukprot:XP_001435795.1 hypothetical protein (macronuclear) [Paramecium tetraurelia strain d4-2]
MGGCLFRKNSNNKQKENVQVYYQLSQGSETSNLMDEMEDVREVENIKNWEILQITQIDNKCIILKKPSVCSFNYKVIEIGGDGNAMYLEIHKQLQYSLIQLRQSSNYFVGAVTIDSICYLVLRILQGLAAQVSVQEMQCLDIEENIENTIKSRYDEKFICVGAIYLNELVILVFRQFLLKIQCPVIQQYQTFDQNTTCILTYDSVLYQLKKQI